MSNEEIRIKANEILDETKMIQDKYHEERILIFKLLERSKEQADLYELLEIAIKIYEKNKIVEEVNKKYKRLKLDSLADEIRKQEIRKEDNKSSIALFLLEDKNKHKHTFLTRESASEYLLNNKELFDENKEIEIVENENIDLENLINHLLEF